MVRAVALVLLVCFAASAAAQGYPSRVVRIIGPEPFGQFIKTKIAKWAGDGREAGMQPE